MAFSSQQSLTTLRFMQKAFLALCMAASLSACAPVLIGGVAGGAFVVTDRRTPGAQLEDAAITVKANGEVKSVLGDRGNVSVSSYNRRVLVTGEVNTEQEKKIDELTEKISNMSIVTNHNTTNKFNLNFFLNNECKDAIDFQTFLK